MDQFTVRDGDIMGWRSETDGQPVILIHAAGTTSALWDDHVDLLKPDFQPITYDLRGHGESGPTGVKEYTDELFIDDLDAIVDTCSTTPFIVGVSLGARVSIAYANTYSNKIAGVVVSGIAERHWIVDYIVPVVQTIQSAVLRRYEYIEPFISYEPSFRYGEFKKLKKYMSQSTDPDIEEAFRNVDRVLVLHGEKEGSLPDVVTEQEIPRAVIPDSGHLVPKDNPSAVTDGLRAFMTR